MAAIIRLRDALDTSYMIFLILEQVPVYKWDRESLSQWTVTKPRVWRACWARPYIPLPCLWPSTMDPQRLIHQMGPGTSLGWAMYASGLTGAVIPPAVKYWARQPTLFPFFKFLSKRIKISKPDMKKMIFLKKAFFIVENFKYRQVKKVVKRVT